MFHSTAPNARRASFGARIRDWHVPPPPLGRVLELALFLRVAAAVGVQWYVQRTGSDRVCVFPDADYYWSLAGSICRGTTYEIVEWGDIPHFALRTPGYPAFLAGCRSLLGDRPLGARLVQAALGMASVWLVYRLSLEVLGKRDGQPDCEQSSRPAQAWTAPLLAAALAAVHPYFVVMSALLLSEALFVPLMLLALWGLAVLCGTRNAEFGTTTVQLIVAFGVGLASGAAVLTRPSWALFVPGMTVVLFWCRIRLHDRRRTRFSSALGAVIVMIVGLVVTMGPWWVRNARIYQRFVPTAIWMGASLYDGLNPAATGASNMDFLTAPDLWPLDELDQDRELTRRALAFARQEPARVLRLALIKMGRYWCPWPNAEGFRSLWLALASAGVMVPLLAAIGLGLFRRRHDVLAWVVLAGPLLYFCGVHLVFASSMRYRIPAEVPAMGLAALGFMTPARTERHDSAS